MPLTRFNTNALQVVKKPPRELFPFQSLAVENKYFICSQICVLISSHRSSLRASAGAENLLCFKSPHGENVSKTDGERKRVKMVLPMVSLA